MNTRFRTRRLCRVGFVGLACLMMVLVTPERLQAARSARAGAKPKSSILLLTVPGESPPWQVMELAAHQTDSLHTYMNASLRSKAWRFVARGALSELSDFERAGDPRAQGSRLVAIRLPKRNRDGWLSFSLKGLHRGRLLALVEGQSSLHEQGVTFVKILRDHLAPAREF